MKLFRNKIIIKEGNIFELLSVFEYGDMLILYEGGLDKWRTHPQGVVILKENKFLLNGTELLYEGDFDKWWTHPQGVVILKENKFLLNGAELLYEGDFDKIIVDLSGLVVENKNELILSCLDPSHCENQISLGKRDWRFDFDPRLIIIEFCWQILIIAQ